MVDKVDDSQRASLDDILRDIGEFGPYQRRVFTFLCLACVIVAALLLLPVFLLAVPQHRCKLPWLPNDTYAIQSEWHRRQINIWIPPSPTGSYVYDQCNMYASHMNNNTELQQCTDWVYDKQIFINTFATQLNMVCENSWRIPGAQSIFFFGSFLGSLLYGKISDLFGRRKGLYVCIIVQLISSAGLLVIRDYMTFCAVLFLLGGCVPGLYTIAYVLGLELVGPTCRLWAGNLPAVCLALGELYLVLTVYLFPDWFYFTLACAAPTLLLLPYYWIIPESCRWLLSKGKTEAALVILQNIAGDSSNKKISLSAISAVSSAKTSTSNWWRLFTIDRTLALWTIILFINWFIGSMSFYGIMLYADNMSGNVLLNFSLLVLVEFPAKVVDIGLMDRIGRKRLYAALMILGGVAYITTIVFPFVQCEDKDILVTFLTLLGKFSVTGAYGALYVHSAEIFPTELRNTGMGLSSAMARLGSMVAPYIASAVSFSGADFGLSVPLAIFGMGMFMSGILSLLILPETNGKQLPETIEDIRNF